MGDLGEGDPKRYKAELAHHSRGKRLRPCHSWRQERSKQSNDRQAHWRVCRHRSYCFVATHRPSIAPHGTLLASYKWMPYGLTGMLTHLKPISGAKLINLAWSSHSQDRRSYRQNKFAYTDDINRAQSQFR